MKGLGSALKPSFEPIVVARKPLVGTLSANVLAHGTGALNIDASRIAGDVPTTTRGGNQFGIVNDDGWQPSQTGQRIEPHTAGRWPANVVLDASQAAALDQQSGDRPGFSGGGTKGAGFRADYVGGHRRETELLAQTFGDSGGASRFFKTVDDVTPRFMYTAKAGSDERPNVDGVAHPTVKSLDLMRWLVKLVTPKGGTVLEPFAGSGTTVEAAVLEGFRCIAIEREVDYLPLIMQRVSKPHAVGLDFGDWEDVS